MHTLAQQIVNPVLPGNLGSGGSGAGAPAIGLLVSNIVWALVIFAFIASFLYLLLGGFNWITSGGDKAKLQAARDEITNAIIGIIVVAACWAIMTLVGNFLGISFPNLQFPTLGG
jgi:hypothetical protein